MCMEICYVFLNGIKQLEITPRPLGLVSKQGLQRQLDYLGGETVCLIVTSQRKPKFISFVKKTNKCTDFVYIRMMLFLDTFVS